MVDPIATTATFRPSRWRRALLVVAAAALALPIALCASSVIPASAADETKLKVALTSDIDTLNPFLAILASSTGILRFQYESLVQYGDRKSTRLNSSH